MAAVEGEFCPTFCLANTDAFSCLWCALSQSESFFSLIPVWASLSTFNQSNPCLRIACVPQHCSSRQSDQGRTHMTHSPSAYRCLPPVHRLPCRRQAVESNPFVSPSRLPTPQHLHLSGASGWRWREFHRRLHVVLLAMRGARSLRSLLSFIIRCYSFAFCSRTMPFLISQYFSHRTLLCGWLSSPLFSFSSAPLLGLLNQWK